MTKDTPQKTILFVDDAPELRMEMRELLEQEDFRMVEAADGEEAMTVAKKEHPDLILLDLILPRGGGLSILEKFRNDSDIANVPVLILTNLDDAEHVEQAMALGAKAYLVKTRYSLPDIIERIRTHLSSGDV